MPAAMARVSSPTAAAALPATARAATLLLHPGAADAPWAECLPSDSENHPPSPPTTAPPASPDRPLFPQPATNTYAAPLLRNLVPHPNRFRRIPKPPSLAN